jgi:radical SAM protein with 4Fe4S-binding SPASM domain
MEKVKRMGMDAEPLWSTYMNQKAAALGIPLTGNFELTTRCNFNCKMCYVHDNSQPDALTAEDWLRIAKEACDAGMVFALLTGGEPMLRKDFPEIYRGIKKMGVLISINSNGASLNDELFELLRKDPPLRINVTLYGGSNETYRRLCGVPAYDTVVSNIRKLRAAGIQVRVNASITPDNREDIAAIFQTCNELDVPVKATTYMFPPVRVNGGQFGDAPARFSWEDAARYMVTCREQYMTPEQLTALGEGELSPEPDECVDGTGEHVKCRAGRSTFWVTWDGRMLPCGMFPVEGYSIPDMGFTAAWERVKAYVGGLTLPAACTDCPDRKRCSVCAASALCETGSTDQRPAYICNMTRAIHRYTREKYPKKESQHES